MILRIMDTKELRSMIRSSLKRQIKEAKQKLTSPKSLSDFRAAVANAMRTAGAPTDLVDEVGDVGYEGGGVFEAIWNTWQNIEAEIQYAKGPEKDQVYRDVAPGYVHDMVLDIIDAYQNAYNYEPGRKPSKLNGARLAADFVAAMFPPSQRAPEMKFDRKMKDMVNLVTDILGEAGADDVSVSGSSITYSGSPAVEAAIKREAPKAGLKSSGSGTWLDDLTGLSVTFDNGTVTIS